MKHIEKVLRGRMHPQVSSSRFKSILGLVILTGIESFESKSNQNRRFRSDSQKNKLGTRTENRELIGFDLVRFLDPELEPWVLE